MSRDWLVVAAVALGHAALFVWAVNVTHAIGLTERWMNRVKALLAVALVGGASWLGWEFAHGPLGAWSVPARVYALACLATALAGLPLGTLARALRRQPAGVSGRGTEVDLRQALGVDALIGPGKHNWLFHLPANESLRLRKLDWDLALPGLPPPLDGLSILHVSDLHFARCFTRTFFEAVAEQAAGWEVDLVLFTGDLIDHDDCLEWVEPVMSRLRGRLGAFAILGNHDVLHHPVEIRREVERAGFTDLEGRWEHLRHEGATLAVGGTSFPWGPPLNPRETPEAGFRLLLSHSPDRFSWAARQGIDLVLAGHNHGGQVRLPLIGPVVMPSLYSRRFDREFFQTGKTLMHVSQGVAGQHPIRYGCVPEVARLVLRLEARRPGERPARRRLVERDPLPS
jgi:predicted MPP superfamily phosphohydrolase